MSPSPSPAPDVASPADSKAHSPRREESEPAQDNSEHEREPSEDPHDSELESKSPDDASAEASSSSTSAAADPTSASTSASASASAPDSSSASPSVPGTASQGDWQAVWSSAHNAYYFYNSLTHETTWVNPLQPNAEAGPSNVGSDSPEASSSTADPSYQSTPGSDLYAAAAAQGIDPALAHLDPSLGGGSSTNPAAFTYTAKFNARTGAFTRPDGRDPTHLSEYERAKRMSEFYFDVNAWESDVAQRKLEEAQEEEEGRKRKRPTKKDLERFKEQKRQKKLAKTAWLRT
ncbi:hypothetical protein GSI_09210 [Ganoderma sinense ZZ0214-1]|uniref:WW domain-containing protein n=1 Tax=Ganoderma sinense ZZ0214-1 TaxID=1077348 RepID=A0A2G8S5W9_9APHY|nr:hypothetical protein GSI_09210 [Ganoderma sinense ZZ0214-1]